MDKKAKIETLFREARDKGGFNGAWLYAERGEIVSKGAYGWRDAENTLPVQEDTIFEMASVTKMFTATAVMLLVRAGKLRLDDELAGYFPEFPCAGVTIRHLLTHTGGIPDYDVEKLVAPVLEKEKRIPSCGEVIRLMRESEEKPVGAPGERFCYSDIGYALLADTVEKVSGVCFEDFLKKNVFEPAGMKDSGIFHTRRDGRPSDRFARNMVLEDGDYVPSDVSKSTAPYVVGSDGLNGCDYLYTTIFDMLAWDRALREEKVLTRAEQQIMYTPGRLNSGEPARFEDDEEAYGFGWGIGQEPELGLVVSHSGGMPGLETWFERFVDADRVFAVMCCRDFTDARAYWGFWDGIKDIARDREPKPLTCLEEILVKDPDKSGWESFCGRYEHPADAEFIIDEVYMKDESLHARAIDDEGKKLDFRLYPIGENVFGRKGGLLRVSFGDGCLTIDGLTCRKL